MQAKARLYPNGNSVTLDRNHAFYVVKVYIGTELHDKMLCDTHEGALDYFRAFCAVAKNHR